MEDILELIKKNTKEDHEYVVNLRRHFHKYPETPKNEFNTALKIEEELDKIGVSHKRVGETGVFATIKGNKPGNKIIVLRADIDALPLTEKHECEYKSVNEGVMHACGHDAHTAGLLGAARVLTRLRDKFSGEVRLIFQQAEEIGYGGRIFVNEGYLNGANRTFGIHVASNIEVGKIALVPGPNNASVDWFKITVKGVQAHVSTPQEGVDALYIASQIVVSLQALVSRMSSPMDNVLIGIGKLNAGTAYNIVAGEATLEGTLRCLTEQMRKEKISKIDEVAKTIAKIYGGEALVEWQDFTSPLVNDLTASLEAQDIAKQLFGEENVITNRQPSLGGDDFAEFIKCVPGVYAFVGTGNSKRPETVVAHHNEVFDIDENGLLTSVEMYSAYAIKFLNNL